jgi:hypothetical protein
MYDTFDDHCESAASEYRSELSTLESELSTVSSRIRSVNLSCGIELPDVSGPAKSKGSGNALCDVIRGYVGTLPQETLMKLCTDSMSEAECKKCLSSK